ncbi:MAG TPA: asparagine synthetase B family protein [Planctomycetota bacterium]|nr:asparagine synthetase B family protein [Planctomycetota bacterium]HRR80685.1 asparagine synthetase B family protein [Planctomycetota bacterium]HRT93273.1 asparagine synthetase B family protein [Planctomycetota bacterium]
MAATGFAFSPNALLEGTALAGALSRILGEEAPEAQAVCRWLRGLNGSFALAVETDRVCFAAVDRLRSRPLFYAESNGKLFVSDDAEWVRSQVADDAADQDALAEFLLTGYVTGQDTLCPRVKQLQAGECLIADKRERVPRVRTHRYYRFVHGDYLEANEEALLATMDEMLVGVFERLLASTAGRPLVVPLSGGQDSRLVVAMLRRLGRSDVLCLSYGRPNNWESRVSQAVALKLGYAWEFVPACCSQWRQQLLSEEAKAYHSYRGGLSSLASVQDWPAIWALKAAGKIPDDAVIVPGHTGDVISGSHIPRDFADRTTVGAQDLLRILLHDHYGLWRWPRRRGALHAVMAERVLRCIGDLPTETPEEAASALECWEWQERQAKFIVNFCRAYEFWGYDWRIPLWDSAMCDFWARVPLRLRLGQRLYNAYVNRVLFSELGISQDDFRDLRRTARGRDAFEGNWRLEKLPFYHPWWGFGSYRRLAEAYPVYRHLFGFSMPTLSRSICFAYEAAAQLRALGDAGRVRLKFRPIGAVRKGVELAALFLGALAVKVARFARRRLGRRAR